MMRNFFLILAGGSYGRLAAAGVFTVLAAVGLVPRFAGKTHTAEYVLIYEEMVVFGTLTGCVLSVFSRYCRFHAWWLQRAPQHGAVLDLGLAIISMAAGKICGSVLYFFTELHRTA